MENTETIGNVLKRERESRGLSIKEVQDATKITIQNLSALEEDRFDAFPNRVYTRAFLRDYANYLGLDSEALIAQYESGLKERQDPVIVAPVRRRSPWKLVLSSAFVVIVLAGLAAAAWYYNEKGNKDAADLKIVEKAAPPKQNAPVATLPKVPDVPSTPNAVTPASPANPGAKPVNPAAPGTTPAPVPAAPAVPEKLSLQVAATQAVWVRIEADGKKIYEGIMPQGGVKTWDATKKISIRAGKAGAVQLKLNGVTQPSLGALGTPGEKEFKITPPAAPTGSAAPTAPAPAKPAAPAPKPAKPIPG